MLAVIGCPMAPPIWDFAVESMLMPLILLAAVLAWLFFDRDWVRWAAWLAIAGEVLCLALAIAQRGWTVLLPVPSEHYVFYFSASPAAYALVRIMARATLWGAVLLALSMPLWRQRFQKALYARREGGAFPVVLKS